GGVVRLDPETGATTPVAAGNTNGEGIWLRGAEKRKYPTPPKIEGILVVDHSSGQNQITKIDPKTGATRVVARGPDGMNGVLMDQKKRIFATWRGGVGLVDEA